MKEGTDCGMYFWGHVDTMWHSPLFPALGATDSCCYITSSPMPFLSLFFLGFKVLYHEILIRIIAKYVKLLFFAFLVCWLSLPGDGVLVKAGICSVFFRLRWEHNSEGSLTDAVWCRLYTGGGKWEKNNKGTWVDFFCCLFCVFWNLCAWEENK